jgi:hypothetical protein
VSSPRLEAFLARLYTEDQALADFLAAPAVSAADAGLDAAEIAALAEIDRDGLVMAARSFAAKRAAQRRGRAPLRDIVARTKRLLLDRRGAR